MKQPWEDVGLNFFLRNSQENARAGIFFRICYRLRCIIIIVKDAILESVKDLGEVDFLQLDAFSKNWNLRESFDKENDLIILLTLLAVPNTVFMMHCIQGLCP